MHNVKRKNQQIVRLILKNQQVLGFMVIFIDNNPSFEFKIPIEGEASVYSAVVRGDKFHYLALSKAVVTE